MPFYAAPRAIKQSVIRRLCAEKHSLRKKRETGPLQRLLDGSDKEGTISEKNILLKYRIRPIKTLEIPLLEDFLYEAIFQRDAHDLIPRSVIAQPEIKVFIENFGKPDDHCLVATDEDKLVGAVWTRILAGPVKGFGNLDPYTPEFAISLYREYRGQGIGTELMQRMLKLLKEKGYARASLSVQKDNYAVGMYRKLGFSTVCENGEDYIMVCTI